VGSLDANSFSDSQAGNGRSSSTKQWPRNAKSVQVERDAVSSDQDSGGIGVGNSEVPRKPIAPGF
jgi:hypothetical protein